MIDTRPTYTPEILALMHMPDEMVFAKDLAPIVKMILYSSVTVRVLFVGLFRRELRSHDGYPRRQRVA